jgi:hypothetical protein
MEKGVYKNLTKFLKKNVFILCFHEKWDQSIHENY